jgi:hypothetical protein
MSYDTIAELNNALVRKALKGSLFIAPETADPVTADNLFAVGGELQALPAGYEDGGLTTDDGLRFSRAVEISNITSWQRTTPTRSDKSSDVETVQVDFQELKIPTLEAYTGADLSAVTPGSNGAISIQKPAIPTDPYFRLLALAVDLVDGDELVIAYFFPRAKVASYADQAFAKGDNAINWGMTFTTYSDDDLGYSKDLIIGGPGFATLATEMGFGGS